MRPTIQQIDSIINPYQFFPSTTLLNRQDDYFYVLLSLKRMLQHDGRYTNATALNRCRPLDDSDASIIASTSKRQCLDQNTQSKSEVSHSDDKKCGMDATMDDVDTSTGSGDNKNALSITTTLSPDEILIQMVQSGCYSQEDVVNFCISSGIPLSRMLRLDLMRLSNNTKR